jgi:S1-C subfamily serine protease
VYAKEFLSQKGVPYTEKDVSKDRAAAQEMIQKTNQMGVPVITVGDQYVIGFDRRRLEELLAGQGGVTGEQKPSFGLQIADASKITQKAGVLPVFGAFVGAVKPGSAADKAGLQQGDVITEINLRPVSNADDLARALSGLSRGNRVNIAFLRGQQKLYTETVI